MADDIHFIRVVPHELDWLPVEAKTLDEALQMGAHPPRLMTRADLEKEYPSCR